MSGQLHFGRGKCGTNGVGGRKDFIFMDRNQQYIKALCAELYVLGPSTPSLSFSQFKGHTTSLPPFTTLPPLTKLLLYNINTQLYKRVNKK